MNIEIIVNSYFHENTYILELNNNKYLINIRILYY